jgi:hypothetical protein
MTQNSVVQAVAAEQSSGPIDGLPYTWEELKQVVPFSLQPEPLRRFVELLQAEGYARIASVLASSSGLLSLPRVPGLIANQLWGGAHRNFKMTAMPGLHRAILGRASAPLLNWFRVAFLGEATPRRTLERDIGEDLVGELIACKALVPDRDDVRFTISFVPYGDWIILRDGYFAYPAVGPNRFQGRVWMGLDTIELADFLKQQLRRSDGCALEIGAGTGVQTLVASRFFDEAVGVDFNPRAVRFSQLNAEVNGVGNARFRESDLFSAVEGERFDALLTNPWYCSLAEGGMEMIPSLLEGAVKHLADGGSILMMATSYRQFGKDTLEGCLRSFLERHPRYDIEVKEIGYSYPRFSHSEARAHGISLVTPCFATLREGGTGKLVRRRPDVGRAARDLVAVGLGRTLAAAKSRTGSTPQA